MANINFNREFSANYGVLEDVAPGIRRIMARNPSAFTFHGTGTYVIGKGHVAVIDPGPDDETHINALLTSLTGETITHIFITHTHLDHSPGTRLLQLKSSARSYGFGPHGRSELSAGQRVEEGADWEFSPDHSVTDGEVIVGNDWTIECVYTPGHTSNHMCYQYREQQALFCGDHVMAWSTSIIAPPDGDLTNYLGSLKKLLKRNDKTYWPTHGAAIGSPQAFVESYIKHRYKRIEEIIECLTNNINTIPSMVKSIYSNIPESLHGAAAYSVFATILYLIEQGRVSCDGTPKILSNYQLTGNANP